MLRSIYIRGLGRILGLLLLAVGANAAVTQAESAAKTQLDTFLLNLRTLRADFTQTLRDAQGGVIEKSSGVLAIQRPGRFRWDYQQPHPQVIVADGQRLWLYDVDLDQVTVRDMEQSLAGTPASLLSDGDDLRDNFTVTDTETKGNVSAVTLAPKREDTDFRQVRIRFVDQRLDSMELFDKLGQSTLLEFANVQRNASLDEKQFAFSPPPGVDVIGATAPSQSESQTP